MIRYLCAHFVFACARMCVCISMFICCVRRTTPVFYDKPDTKILIKHKYSIERNEKMCGHRKRVHTCVPRKTEHQQQQHQGT